MAHHKSAKKRIKQNEVRRLRNRSNMSAMKTSIGKVKEAIEKKDLASATTLFCAAQSVIAKTRKKGIIHVNNMARRISRLSLAINKLKSNVSPK